eukprot:SAG31_NODE_312_length_17856_cov_14.557827_8_plen_465_part_00
MTRKFEAIHVLNGYYYDPKIHLLDSTKLSISSLRLVALLTASAACTPRLLGPVSLAKATLPPPLPQADWLWGPPSAGGRRRDCEGPLKSGSTSHTHHCTSGTVRMTTAERYIDTERAMKEVLTDMKKSLDRDMEKFQAVEQRRRQLQQEGRRHFANGLAAQRRLTRRARWAKYLQGRIKQGRVGRGSKPDMEDLLERAMCILATWHSEQRDIEVAYKAVQLRVAELEEEEDLREVIDAQFADARKLEEKVAHVVAERNATRHRSRVRRSAPSVLPKPPRSDKAGAGLGGRASPGHKGGAEPKHDAVGSGSDQLRLSKASLTHLRQGEPHLGGSGNAKERRKRRRAAKRAAAAAVIAISEEDERELVATDWTGAELLAAEIAAEVEMARVAAEEEVARVAAEEEVARVAAEEEAAEMLAAEMAQVVLKGETYEEGLTKEKEGPTRKSSGGEIGDQHRVWDPGGSL